MEISMRIPFATRWPVFAVLAMLLALPLSAEEFDQIVAVLKKTWPDRKEVAIVCDLASSQLFIDDFKKAAGSGLKVKIYDVKSPGDIGKAMSQIVSAKAEVLVLVPSDPVAGDGLKEAEYLIKKLAGSKIPALATTEVGVRQGALIGTGPATNGAIYVNPKAAAVVGLPLPANGKSI
jgi:ABC-type uncharacterized transport system substrate-binding protein